MTVHERAAETYKTLNDAGRSHDECLREAVNTAIEACAEVAANFLKQAHVAHSIRTGVFPEQSDIRDAIADEIRALSDGGQKNEC